MIVIVYWLFMIWDVELILVLDKGYIVECGNYEIFLV